MKFFTYLLIPLLVLSASSSVVILSNINPSNLEEPLSEYESIQSNNAPEFEARDTFLDDEIGSKFDSESKTQQSEQVSNLNLNAVDAYESDDTFETAKRISIGEAQQRSISPLYDVDYVIFSLQSHQEVTIETSGGGSVDDTYLLLYDENRNLITYDNDGGVGRFSLINRDLAPGTYYIQVSDYTTEREISSYALQLNIAGDSYEPDNVFSSASYAVLPTIQTHSLHRPLDFDYVTFTVLDYVYIHIETSGSEGHDTEIWLYDDTFKERNYDDDGGVNWFSKIITMVSAGTYYVKISEWGLNNAI
ncbi:MAG: PPC domain-containing protein, partial [Candidatus Kariarchaeaceae archaeon]